jgi:hypothetical protein
VDALNLIRTTMEEHFKSPTSERSQTSKKTIGRKDKHPKNVMPSGKRWRRSKVSEKEEVSKIMYLQPTHMHDVGDRNEGGELLVNDVCITKGGVKSMDEWDILIERDCNESPLSVPSVYELLERRREQGA